MRKAGLTHKRVSLLIILWVMVLALVIAVAAIQGHGHMAVLSPAGEIGTKERRLIYTALGLSTIVVIPVFIMLFGFAWRYRESNHQARYTPDVSGNRVAETIWWLIPLALISVLSVITWQSSHALDPFRSLSSKTPAITVDVIAMQWKWLFLYPEQGIATVNSLSLPTDTPVSFYITSDAPMNSFWIPQLGGQIYAMSGMSTQLHLMANKPGDYRGLSANISGTGFSSMTFTAHAMLPGAFTQWAKTTRSMPTQLTRTTYDNLSQPGVLGTPLAYSSYDPSLYDYVMSKYMAPGTMAHMTTVGVE